jgi:hypothetical protein
MTNANFVGLVTLTMNPCSLTKAARREARQTWLCTGCCAPKPSSDPIDAYLEERPRDKPLNFINGTSLTVIYKPFLDQFPAEAVARDLILGSIYGPRGRLLTDWVTLRGRKEVIIRGSKDAGYRICTDCGRKVYFAMDREYLYPALPLETDIFERSGGGGIVVSTRASSGIDLSPYRRLDVIDLPVLDRPLDGFDELVHD